MASGGRRRPRPARRSVRRRSAARSLAEPPSLCAPSSRAPSTLATSNALLPQSLRLANKRRRRHSPPIPGRAKGRGDVRALWSVVRLDETVCRFRVTANRMWRRKRVGKASFRNSQMAIGADALTPPAPPPAASPGAGPGGPLGGRSGRTLTRSIRSRRKWRKASRVSHQAASIITESKKPIATGQTTRSDRRPSLSA